MAQYQITVNEEILQHLFSNNDDEMATNNIERLNEEIRRRERVIRIFPNEASAIR